MVHAETDSLLQMLKQAQKMEELLKRVKPDSGLSVSVCTVITFCVKRSQTKCISAMAICVSLYVCVCLFVFLSCIAFLCYCSDPDNFEEWLGCPVVVHY